MRAIRALTLMALWTSPPQAAEPVSGSDVSPTIWREDAKVLSCSPSELFGSGVVVLRLGPNHGKELAIRRESDNRWFPLVVESPPDKMIPLMTPEQFRVAQRIEFAANVRGYGDTAAERVFSSPGRYYIHTSRNIESEIGGYVCAIEFRGAENAR